MSAPLDTDVAIETPEHIVFRHRVAGPARRLLAYLLDLLLCYGALIFIAFVVMLAAAGAAGVASGAESATQAGLGFILIAAFAAQWLYFVVFEGMFGSSPGKRAAGLRVVTTEGRPIGIPQAALRNILRAADMMPVGYVVGLVSMALSPRFQRVGDLVAGTMVVIPEHAESARGLRLWPPPRPHELAALPDVVVLDADERAALELFLRRRGRLGEAREQELASMIIGPLAARTGFRLPDAARTLALLYDRAVESGRGEAPASTRTPSIFPPPIAESPSGPPSPTRSRENAQNVPSNVTRGDPWR